MFYADRLLRIGGYLLIDDALHNGPKKAIVYSDKNYKRRSGFSRQECVYPENTSTLSENIRVH